jgi:carbon storage regulator
MLVLTRRLNESVVIPELGVTIRLVAVKGNAVRIGIEAPHDVAVFREELLAQAGARKKADEPCLVGVG